MFPSCTHPEPSASFAASGVKTQDNKNAVKDVGFMVNEAPPSTRGAAFLLQWSPRNTKGGLQIWPKER